MAKVIHRPKETRKQNWNREADSHYYLLALRQIDGWSVLLVTSIRPFSSIFPFSHRATGRWCTRHGSIALLAPYSFPDYCNLAAFRATWLLLLPSSPPGGQKQPFHRSEHSNIQPGLPRMLIYTVVTSHMHMHTLKTAYRDLLSCMKCNKELAVADCRP